MDSARCRCVIMSTATWFKARNGRTAIGVVIGVEGPRMDPLATYLFLPLRTGRQVLQMYPIFLHRRRIRVLGRYIDVPDRREAGDDNTTGNLWFSVVHHASGRNGCCICSPCLA